MPTTPSRRNRTLAAVLAATLAAALLPHTSAAAGSRSDDQRLTASDASKHSHFGTAVAISGDHAIVGAIDSDPAQSSPGRAYVFRRVDRRWEEATQLVASEAGP